MVALHGCLLNVWRKSSLANTQECCWQSWTSHGGSTPQSSSCTLTYHLSRKLSKLDKRHCQRSKDELISGLLLWTPSHGWAKAGRPARNYIQQLCADIGCSPEDLPEAIDDRKGWQERVRNIHVDGTTWWWWWDLALNNMKLLICHKTKPNKPHHYIYIYICVCVTTWFHFSLMKTGFLFLLQTIY